MKEEKKKTKKIFFIPLILSIGIPLIIASFINVIMPYMGELYDSLNKPFFAPPGSVFPIVWTILYILMGIACYRVYILKYRGIDTSSAIFTYSIQLLLNFLWVFIFFGLRLYGIAFIELLIILFFAVLTFIKFYNKDKIAGLLFIPYLLWLTYAGVLNFYVWMLNEM
ncbi:tryptophan-rich sensory protein [Clostridium botulinum]|uniref:TspO/MBR family protein n=1 Tax=unclassified Clostridium TaxID=2614128 RepID=UPI00050632F2|nr:MULTISPECIES: TspO/MBR family protein [unclassified Clostridium]AIY79402.1 tspO/MBR family protein [Clostridium botulinum 202F]KAI3346701.1 tryptophan-rich sensory protein [Clostridium botulinum]KFX53780.1 TspO [Clostridium botulinum]KFX57271.1 TspO [Clostridium botulinum]KON13946.1 TspO [Clostridium botulinum]